MAVILPEILANHFVSGVISRIFLPTKYLSRTFGFQLGGPNVETVSGRVDNFDIFDNPRTVTNARSPSAPAGTIAPNPVGRNSVALATFKESIPLEYKDLARIKQIGGPADSWDKMGAQYIARQCEYLKMRAENAREFLTGALFNGGKYAFYINGDDWVPTYNTSGTFVVDLKYDSEFVLTGGSFAAGLPMRTGSNTVTATWSDNATDIPLQLDAISSAFQDKVGAPLASVFCGTDVWRNVIDNTKIRTVAGTSNIPAEFSQEADMGPDGTPSGVIKCVLKARPWITWYVWDGSLSLATSSATTFGDVKLLPRNYATFMIDHQRASWLKLVEGSEYIAEADGIDPTEQVGFYAYAIKKCNPSRVWYHTNQVAGIRNQMTKGIAWARVQ